MQPPLRIGNREVTYQDGVGMVDAQLADRIDGARLFEVDHDHVRLDLGGVSSGDDREPGVRSSLARTTDDDWISGEQQQRGLARDHASRQ